MAASNSTVRRVLRVAESAVSIALTVALMCFIFGMSAKDGVHSQSLSYRVAEWFVEMLNSLFGIGLSPAEISKWAIDVQLVVRKGAHITEFAVLCALALKSVSTFVRLTIPKVIVTALGCVAFAALDELHQTFVPGRDGSVGDVLVDSVGIALTTAVVCWWIHRKNKLLADPK